MGRATDFRNLEHVFNFFPPTVAVHGGREALSTEGLMVLSEVLEWLLFCCRNKKVGEWGSRGPEPEPSEYGYMAVWLYGCARCAAGEDIK